MEDLVTNAWPKEMKVSHSNYPFDMGADGNPVFDGDHPRQGQDRRVGGQGCGRKGFYDNKDKYSETAADGTMVVAGNTFKLVTAIK